MMMMMIIMYSPPGDDVIYEESLKSCLHFRYIRQAVLCPDISSNFNSIEFHLTIRTVSAVFFLFVSIMIFVSCCTVRAVVYFNTYQVSDSAFPSALRLLSRWRCYSVLQSFGSTSKKRESVRLKTKVSLFKTIAASLQNVCGVILWSKVCG